MTRPDGVPLGPGELTAREHLSEIRDEAMRALTHAPLERGLIVDALTDAIANLAHIVPALEQAAEAGMDLTAVLRIHLDPTRPRNAGLAEWRLAFPRAVANLREHGWLTHPASAGGALASYRPAVGDPFGTPPGAPR